MCHLETAFEWLRPLVLDSSGIWDYCVLWKLGDDPSRFIEFLGCCCNGGGKQEMGLRKRKREKSNSMRFCRDVNHVHLANTNPCQVLANLPPFMSIYSGLHGEVVLSCQPQWLTSKKSDSKMSTEESCGTHVLIPVFGGLVELYSSKHVEEDDSVIEYVKSQFNIYSELETMSTSTISFDGQSIDPFLDIKSNIGLSSLNQPNISAWPQPSTLPSIAQRYSDSTLDGSSTGSFPSDERPSPDSNPCSVSQDIPSKPLMASHKDPVIVQEKHGLERGTGKSKNLLTERNRRQRINDGILSLRALVPKITKMHKAATLSDAIDYIEELNNEIKELQDELKSLIEEDSDEKHTLKLKANLGEKISKPKHASSVTERLKVNVQANQLGNGNFLLRIICQQKPGVYTKLLEALSALGLPIKDANLTMCDGQVSTIFTVQSNKKEIREEDLRDSLSRLTA